MNDENLVSLQQEFLRDLKEIYGEYELENHIYQFKNYAQKIIAEEIGMEASALNNALNVNKKLRPETWRRYIQQVKNLGAAKAYRKLEIEGVEKRPIFE